MTNEISEDALEVWRLLQKQSLKEMMQKSLARGEPTPQLLDKFHEIANKFAQRPNFVDYAYKDEMIHEAFIQMVKVWHRTDTYASDEMSILAFFVAVTHNAFISFIHREKRQYAIQSDLLKSAKDGTLEFYYQP